MRQKPTMSVFVSLTQKNRRQREETEMTKRDIVVKVSQATGVSQEEVMVVAQATFDCIIEALAQGRNIELRNFGVFRVKERRPRMGRNPRTGETVSVPSRRVAIFKPGLEMRKRVSGV
ncbi:MAG: HU family DNA-binding protein [Candidatus Omnitrophota bacterium]